jgi:[ribosomal protein S18]-alanine N-acetyltransferase
MAAVRIAVSADLPRIIEIASASEAGAHWPVQEYEKVFAADASRYRILLVIERDEQVRGFIMGHSTGPDWEIENFVIRPDWQKKGLGGELLCGFLDLARQSATAQAVYLEVRESNLAARKLYEKMGFAQVGRRRDYYHQPPEDALIYKISF